jgi:hypothetical protein
MKKKTKIKKKKSQKKKKKRNGVSKTIWPGLALNFDPPHISLPTS